MHTEEKVHHAEQPIVPTDSQFGIGTSVHHTEQRTTSSAYGKTSSSYGKQVHHTEQQVRHTERLVQYTEH